MNIISISVNTEWDHDLLSITDDSGYQYFYYQDDNGIMILGQPYIQLCNGYKVTMFLPVPRDYDHPYILSVKPLP